ncbi:MAG TPA: hypothetical protein VF690_19065 [Hymenobacter sp.]|jgi:hypothetical protein
MKLPHLDQLVPLERDDAGLLASALGVLVNDALLSPRPLPLFDAITLPALATMATKFAALHRREQANPPRPGKHPKPRQFRVSYDQMAVLMHYRQVFDYCGLGDYKQSRLRVVMGRFQQKSLNISDRIKFS